VGIIFSANPIGAIISSLYLGKVLSNVNADLYILRKIDFAL
jgi:hypothetical protein